MYVCFGWNRSAQAPGLEEEGGHHPLRARLRHIRFGNAVILLVMMVGTYKRCGTGAGRGIPDRSRSIIDLGSNMVVVGESRPTPAPAPLCAVSFTMLLSYV